MLDFIDFVPRQEIVDDITAILGVRKNYFPYQFDKIVFVSATEGDITIVLEDGLRKILGSEIVVIPSKVFSMSDENQHAYFQHSRAEHKVKMVEIIDGLSSESKRFKYESLADLERLFPKM